jgi:DNA-binding NtrC family response regulator
MTSQARCSQSPVLSAGLYDMNRKSQTASQSGKPHPGDEDIAILIVENEKLVAWDIEQILRDHEFNNILLATSMRGSRDLVKTTLQKIALVILDLKLEDGDATILIDEFSTLGIAVIVVTGYSEFSRADVPVLYKPVATAILLETVKKCLTGRKTR